MATSIPAPAQHGYQRCSCSQAIASPAWLWGGGNETSNFAFPVPKDSPTSWLSPGSGWCHPEVLKMLTVGIWG